MGNKVDLLRKRLIRCSILSFLAMGLVGCGTISGTPFASPVSPVVIGMVTPSPELGNAGIFNDGKYFKKDGHFHTVAFIAQIAGLNDQATRLACFSQAPDEIKRYNAVPVALWGVVSWTYRRRILDSLHSLHGGDYAAVARRRATLHRLVKASLASQDSDWQTGFLIHALGDSFAHVHGDVDKPEAFGSLVGHGFAFFNDPDNIFGGSEPNKNYHKYVAYTSSLFEALSTPGKDTGRTRLISFQKDIAQTAQSAHTPFDVISTLQAYGSKFDERECGRFYEEVDDAKVRAFLEDLEWKLAVVP